MHHIYHTEGIILGSKNFGEAGKYYSIFTRDLGLLYASARGVRNISSRLRYILQDFAYIKVDLVQGKDFWRITSGSKTDKLEHISKNPKALKIFSNIASLLKRLLAGVEKNESLFDELTSGLSLLESAKNDEELESIEAILVLRILYSLGYIGSTLEEKLIKSPFEEGLIFEASKVRLKILHEINKALKETHL